MAEGRLLKRNISDSRRLAELKTDSARMLWTWILPHLDIEGRLHASAELVKGKVCPRIKTMTEEKIRTYLEDMHRVGLIYLYKAEGDEYLEFRKFDVFQNLRPGKEAPSRIPAPDPEAIKKHFECDGGATPEQLPTNSGATPDPGGGLPDKSGTTPGQLRDYSGTTPGQVRDNSGVSKEKISKEKIVYAEAVRLAPAEYERLISRFGKPLTDRAIEILSNAILSKGYKYKSHYHTLLGWPMKEAQAGNGQPIQPPKPKQPGKICDKCKGRVFDTVEYRQRQLCEVCYKTVNPELAPEVAKMLQGVGKRI